MFRTHTVAAVIGTLLLAWGVALGAAGDRTVSGSGVQPARPAVLVLRVTEPPGGGRGPRRVEIVDPNVLAQLPPSSGPSGDAADGEHRRAPQLGPQYELVDTRDADALHPGVHYYTYELNFDLSDPGAVRGWRDFHRAQQDEAHFDRMRRYNEQDMNRRKERLIAAQADVMRDGLTQMQAGDYRTAIITFTLAAELNQGDPACRIHLALARVAVGQDTDAAKVLRRALELQPKLVPMPLGLEDYYPQPQDFAAHTDALAERLRTKVKVTADEYLVLGFMEFQRGRLDDARLAFRQAARGRPRDTLIQSFLDITKPVQAGAPVGGHVKNGSGDHE